MTSPPLAHSAPYLAPANGVHQPWRALVAVAELVVAVLAVVFAVLCWRHGIVRVVFFGENGEQFVSTRWFGNWIGAALGLCALAGVLLLDALRQTLLAARTRRHRAARSDEAPDAGTPESD